MGTAFFRPKVLDFWNYSIILFCFTFYWVQLYIFRKKNLALVCESQKKQPELKYAIHLTEASFNLEFEYTHVYDELKSHFLDP